jgi:uncharacterized protein (TIGR03083 family)
MPLERTQITASLDGLATRATDLLATAGNTRSARPVSPVWTVRDVAAHLATVVLRYRDGPEGRGTWFDDPSELAALNRAQLCELDDVELPALARRIRGDVDGLIDQIDSYGDDQPCFRFHGGGAVLADQALGLLAGELLVHGWDVARALERPWSMPPGDVAVVLHGLTPILPGWVDPARARGHTAAYDVHLRGAARQLWRFRDGELTIDPEPATTTADCHLSGDAGTLLLIMYRRRQAWWGAVTARTIAWGRRPWLAFGLADRFRVP